MTRKGQTATEFVLLVTFMLVVFFIFFIAIKGKITQVTDAQDYLYLQEANNVVLNELLIAEQVRADFQRNFTLPTLGDKLYTIQFTDPYELTSKFGGKEYVNFLTSPVYGNLTFSGNNTIYKTDGHLTLPGDTEYYNSTYAGLFMNVDPEECYISSYESTCTLLAYEDACQSLFSLCNSFCGNNIPESGEDCDPPVASCTPLYGSSCVYCNASCHNQTVVGGFCGDGICTISDENFVTCPSDCLPIDVDVEGYSTTTEVGGSGSGTYLTILQPNGTYGKDAYVDDYSSNINTNYGQNPGLHAGDWGTWGGRRSFVYFNISFLDQPENLLEVNLSLYWHGYSGCNTINAWCYNGRSYPQYYTNAPMYIQRITADWDESTITWNNQPATTSSNSISLPAPTSMVANHTDVDILPLSEDLVSNPNYGFMIRVQTESSYRSVNFASSDNPTSVLRPTLTLTYTICGDEICAGAEDVTSCSVDCS